MEPVCGEWFLYVRQGAQDDVECRRAGGAGRSISGDRILFYISLRGIVRDFKEKDYEIHRTELFFLLIPAAVGLLICVLLRIIMVTLEGDVPEMLYDRYPILILVLPAILLLSLLSILYGVKLFQDMVYRNKTKSERVILKNQVRTMQEHMEEMERIYSEIRGMKHDMKNTVAVIGELAKGEKVSREDSAFLEEGGLQEYLVDLNQSFDRLELRFRTGNAVDNAVRACRELKEKEPEAEVFIRFVSLQKGNLLVLKVEKYHGAMDFMAKDRVFILSMMMKNERGSEDGFWSDR